MKRKADYLITELNLDSAKSASKIAAGIREGIRSGTLPKGALLPTVRFLAAQIGANRNTVAAAYRQLADAGLVRSDGRRGTVVTGISHVLLPAEFIPHDAFPLDSGNPDPKFLPDLSEFCRGLDSEHQLYGGLTQLPDLVAVAKERFARDGLASGEIAITGGALDAFERALSVCLMPGDAVAVEDPCFPGTLHLLSALGLRAVPVAVDEEGMRPDLLRNALSERVRAVVITPRAHNPTGVSLSEARVDNLRRVLAKAPEVLVIEDDYFNGLAKALPAWVGGADRKSWLVVRSLSKSFGPDLRLATLIGDANTIRLIERRQRLGQRWVSHVLQRLTLNLMQDGRTPNLLRQASAAYARRRRAVVSALRYVGIDAVGEDGLNVWLPTLHGQQVTQSLLARGWITKAGTAFSPHRLTGLRISIGQLPDDKIEDLVRDIVACAGIGDRSTTA